MPIGSFIASHRRFAGAPFSAGEACANGITPISKTKRNARTAHHREAEEAAIVFVLQRDVSDMAGSP